MNPIIFSNFVMGTANVSTSIGTQGRASGPGVLASPGITGFLRRNIHEGEGGITPYGR